MEKIIPSNIIGMLSSCKEADLIIDELFTLDPEENYLDLLLLPNLKKIRDLVENYIIESGELWLIVKDLPESIQISEDYVPFFGNYETFEYFQNLYENEEKR